VITKDYNVFHVSLETTDLLTLLPAKMKTEEAMLLKWRGTEENRRNLKKTLFNCHFIDNESYMKSLGIKLKSGENLAANCFSYHTKFKFCFNIL
jgi:hypothetical protein